MSPTGSRALRSLGDPVELVRATAPYTAPEVVTRLEDPALPATLERLGVTEPDLPELLSLIPAAIADPTALAAITEVAGELGSEAGLTATVAGIDHRKPELDAAQQDVRPGSGLVAILAHVVATETVRTWHAARGLSPVQTWDALSDLGQQLRVHRRVFDELGHHTLAFTAKNWAGRLFRLGRLQYELVRAPQPGSAPRWVLDVHVPATGPLAPAAVDDSLDAATGFFTEHFADLDRGRAPGTVPFGHEFTCRSWLLNPELTRVLGADSNLGSFARRWSLEESFEAARDIAFFVFGRRGAVDPVGLPSATRLERALRERLISGHGWAGARGRLIR